MVHETANDRPYELLQEGDRIKVVIMDEEEVGTVVGRDEEAVLVRIDDWDSTVHVYRRQYLATLFSDDAERCLARFLDLPV
jgi:hypothetical protein